MQMHVSRHFYSTFPFYNPHYQSEKIFCVHTGYKANQRGHTRNTQWKQQSILVKCSPTCNLGPQPVLHDCLSFLLLVLAIHLQPPFFLCSLQQDKTLPHIITNILTGRHRGSLHFVNTPITQPQISDSPTPMLTGQSPSPTLFCRWILCSRLCCHQKPDLRDKQSDQNYKQQHRLYHCKKSTFRKKLHQETCL